MRFALFYVISRAFSRSSDTPNTRFASIPAPRIVTFHSQEPRQFFLTPPTACPYLPGRQERKIFTPVSGDNAASLNNFLAQNGFRRSQNIAYRPACEECQACVSVRVPVDGFAPSRNMKRVLADNSDLIGTIAPNSYTSEQYALFRRYVEARHPEGGMAEMSVLEYRAMIEESAVETFVVEYRRRGIDSAFTGRGEGDLLAVALIDRINDGLSMVYSFYDPTLASKSPGTYLILDHITRTRKGGLPYLYLGYWVEGSGKMDYKKRFLPQEHLTQEGWKIR